MRAARRHTGLAANARVPNWFPWLSHKQFQFRAKTFYNIRFTLKRSGETFLANLVRAKISALGTYVPPRLLTNADLEKMVETSNDWIVERTGIRQRQIVDKGMAPSGLAI